MTYLAIFLLLTTTFFWWRARVWKRLYFIAINPHVMVFVGEYAKIWADGFRDTQRTSDWPEELERREDA